MKLSSEQIEQLFLFTEKKLVRFYDLQVEIVDHLAVRIEEEMVVNSKLNFEQALGKIYRDFGIFGFAQIVRQKENQVIKHGRRLLWKAFKDFFSWPKITLVGCIAMVLWQLTQWFQMDILFPLFFTAWLAGICWIIANILRDIKKQKKKLLMIRFSPLALNGSVFYFEGLYFSGNGYHHPWFFCIVVTLVLVLKLASFRVYKTIRQEAALLYPAAFVS